MELKYRYCRIICIYKNHSNRTFMELKYELEIVGAVSVPVLQSHLYGIEIIISLFQEMQTHSTPIAPLWN